MKLIAAVLGVAVFALLVPRADAAPPQGRWSEKPRADQGPVASGSAAFSPQDAARRAQIAHGGKVLAVKADGPGYRVKLLKNGEVRTVYIGP